MCWCCHGLCKCTSTKCQQFHCGIWYQNRVRECKQLCTFFFGLSLPQLLLNNWGLYSPPMSSCGFCQIPREKSEFCRIPWIFYGKHLAGASAIWVSFSMEIPTFFQGILMEMVRIWEPPGIIPNGIHGIPLEFCWNSAGIIWETAL